MSALATRTPTLANRIPSPTESAAIRNDLLMLSRIALSAAPTMRDVDMAAAMYTGRSMESSARGLMTAENHEYVMGRIKAYADEARRNLEARERQVRLGSAA